MVILTSKSSDILVASDGGSPNYLKGIYQFLLFVFAVGVQIVIDVQWLITVPPEAIKVMANNGKEMWICNHYTWEAGKTSTLMSSFVRTNFENHLMSLIYIMVMILITTILSLNAHGIITNHRESIFIGIAAGFR
uniref:G-protein coupled receptors family 3 profile domain-containing protein n=1 Tax=Biomphalaria glabrata TaxID=6526 RepID=A0A2C9LL53_BIOGL